MTIITVAICKLKINFGEYIQQLEAGETIVVTRYERPVAQMVPDAASLNDKLLSSVDQRLAD